jgi:hypothetical protein
MMVVMYAAMLLLPAQAQAQAQAQLASSQTRLRGLRDEMPGAGCYRMELRFGCWTR